MIDVLRGNSTLSIRGDEAEEAWRIVGPILVTLHTSFKFNGLVSVAFWSMALVVISGFVGRYLYVRIPKTLNGSFLGMEAIRARVRELGEALWARSDLPLPQLEAAMALPAPVT